MKKVSLEPRMFIYVDVSGCLALCEGPVYYLMTAEMDPAPGDG